ncbi:MAG: cystathionine beta-synthase [Flavobacteriales bacterium]|nr:MAG: cystathionine beta-synthase [Flavobacteriales bacterium]
MNYFNNILETIGNTPLVKLNKITKDIKATILAKVETTNPGNSVKDRMAVQMIEDAEKEGRLKPGGTVVEGTSGNTGMGLALTCIVKGYKLICTLNDKQSKEKMDMLRAMGTEVIVCPTNVAADDPRSYYSVAKKIAAETPHSVYIDQYNNLSNRKAHYLTTGPELWEQTDGKINHFVVGVGTGGTISGVGKYLKEQNPKIKNWGIDTYGSVFKKYHETGIFDEKEIYPYVTEGIGEDILPENVDFDMIDHFEKVTDKDAALMTRRLAREEGIFVGNSAGAAVAGLLQLKENFKEGEIVVVLFHDHGSRYVGKIFNDEWMRERGFLAKKQLTAIDLIASHKNEKLVTLSPTEKVAEAIMKMRKFDISQIPVQEKGSFIGSVDDAEIFSKLMEDTSVKDKEVGEVMLPPFPFVELNTPIEMVSAKITKSNPAVMVKDEAGDPHIITKHDIIDAIR